MFTTVHNTKWLLGPMLILGMDDVSFPKAMVVGDPSVSLCMVHDNPTQKCRDMMSLIQKMGSEYEGEEDRGITMAFHENLFDEGAMFSGVLKSLPDDVLDNVDALENGFNSIVYNGAITKVLSKMYEKDKEGFGKMMEDSVSSVLRMVQGAYKFHEAPGRYISFVDDEAIVDKMLSDTSIKKLEMDVPVIFISKTGFTDEAGKKKKVVVFETTLKMTFMES